ncbi:unnamed protein product [Cercopithifilaria johnstoni]|uniref:Transmembrane protein n=1 Tax=Cercopithifilaria johnstoni TaxID=2874296 RepID=A0A8J2MS83_9BILA|nr:unnamed protein product [Cercopithifilaria johnstoni]
MVKSAMVSPSHAVSSGSVSTDSTSRSSTTIKLRLFVSLLVLITMGFICHLCQILCLGSGTSEIAGFLILFTAFFGYVWMGIHSCALTRARKAFFDESNVLETYQPRARTMGHLFCPEPPTPAPTVKFSEIDDENKEKHSVEENAAFSAMRDAHYANMFEYAMKMQKEMHAMEKTGNQPESTSSSSIQTTQADQSTGQQQSSVSDSSSQKHSSDSSS